MVMSSWENKTYYELLGVGRGASKAQIKQAYREIALVYHPDSNFYDEIISTPTPSLNSSLFSSITAAYNVLINQNSRDEYDRGLPPELPKWKKEEDALSPMTEKFYQHAVSDEAAEKRKTSALGVFGTIEKAVPSSFSGSFVNDVRPVSEMLKRPWRKGLLSRLCALIGL